MRKCRAGSRSDSRTVDIHVQRLKRMGLEHSIDCICQKCGLQAGGVRDVKLWQRFCLHRFLLPCDISWDGVLLIERIRGRYLN